MNRSSASLISSSALASQLQLPLQLQNYHLRFLQYRKQSQPIPQLPWPLAQELAAGRKIRRFHGMGQVSTASTRRRKAVSVTGIESGGTGQPVVSSTPRRSWELPTEPYLVELELSFGGEEGRFELKSSIEVPTYQEGIGIFREVSVYISNIASRVQSNGG